MSVEFNRIICISPRFVRAYHMRRVVKLNDTEGIFPSLAEYWVTRIEDCQLGIVGFGSSHPLARRDYANKFDQKYRALLMDGELANAASWSADGEKMFKLVEELRIYTVDKDLGEYGTDEPSRLILRF
jgi:hypothetical protein